MRPVCSFSSQQPCRSRSTAHVVERPRLRHRCGVAFVVDRWNFGFGANGIANRITWNDLAHERFTLQSLVTGGDFVQLELPPPVGAERLELPMVYSADAGYSGERWGATAEYAHGFQGHGFHGGLEYRVSAIELRGGGRLSRSRWYPPGGVGFNMSRGVGIDVAVFEASDDIERRGQLGLAVSFRFTPQIQ
jgi:hypothetical protein